MPGVKYGIYDIQRLLDSLLVLDGRLVVLNKGRFAVEQFILARHHMFNQVYTHKTKQCFEEIVKSALESLAENGGFSYPTTKDLLDTSTVNEFVNMDDAWMLHKISSMSSPDSVHWKEAIEKRKPFKMILDSERMAHAGNGGKSLYLKAILEDLDFRLKDGRELDSSGIRRNHVLLVSGGFLSYKLRPCGGSPSDAGESNDSITIYNDKTDRCAPIEEMSGIVRALGKRTSMNRVYVHESVRGPLESYLLDKHPDLRAARGGC